MKSVSPPTSPNVGHPRTLHRFASQGREKAQHYSYFVMGMVNKLKVQASILCYTNIHPTYRSHTKAVWRARGRQTRQGGLSLSLSRDAKCLPTAVMHKS